MSTATTERSPVGRIVQGSLYKPNDKDAEGKPLTIKTPGPTFGQPRVAYYFALAIKKGAESHWNQTPWGAKIYQVAAAGFPQAVQSPKFAWKIEDGDSTIPNGKGRKPCDQPGFAGHWIMKFGGGFAPKVYVSENGAWRQETTPDFLKAGYFAEVAYTVSDNGSQQQPGVYLNYQMVAFRGFGEEIVFGPSAEDVFGNQAVPLPPGASAVPVAGSAPLPATGAVLVSPPNPTQTAAVPPIPAGPAVVPTSVPVVPSKVMTAKAAGMTYEQFTAAGWTDEKMIADGYLTPPPAAPSPIPIVPNPGFLQVPLPGGAPQTGVPVVPSPGPTVPVPPATTSPSKQLTAAAQGATYEQLIAKGWTDTTLIANGLMMV